MDFNIKGKKALVGGASKGLGLACARALAGEGCAVAVVSRSAENLTRARAAIGQEYEVLPIAADLSTPEGIARCFSATDDWGPIDILVNNTGGPPPGGHFDHDEDTWRKAGESLLIYVKRMVDHFVPRMCERGWGRVITITSRTVKEPAGNLVLSNVYRSAVTAYLKGLSREIAAEGVTVNTVLPGAFRTERYEEILEGIAKNAGMDKAEVADQIIASLPQGRFNQPEELAALVAFLASEQASGITGAAIPVDGGALSGLLG